MHHDLLVLNALLRLSRRRTPATLSELSARVAGGPRLLRAALLRLASAGLIERQHDAPPRLTMRGLALSVALTRCKGGSATNRATRRRAA
jgi:predicted transcriptional regulator